MSKRGKAVLAQLLSMTMEITLDAIRYYEFKLIIISILQCCSGTEITCSTGHVLLFQPLEP